MTTNSQQMILAHPYLSDRAGIVASSEASASLAVSNLIADPSPRTPYRSADNTSANGISIDVQLPELDEYGGLTEWNLFAFMYANSGPAAEMRLCWGADFTGDSLPTAMDDAMPGAVPYVNGDTGVVPARPAPAANMDRPGEPDWRHAFVWLGMHPGVLPTTDKDALATGPCLRFFWRDPSPLGGYTFVQAGRLFVSVGYRPSYHHNVGSGLTAAAEKARKSRSQGGALRVGGSARPRAFSFEVGFLERDEAMGPLYEFDRVAGASGDVLVIDSPEDPSWVHRGMIHGYLEPAPIRHQAFDTHTRTYQLEEA